MEIKFRVLELLILGKKGGKRRWRVDFERWYKLEADLTGSYILPSLTLTFKTKSGKEVVLTSPEIFVEVKNEELQKASEGSEKKDLNDSKEVQEGLRDIKPLTFSPLSKQLIFLVSGVLIFLVLVALGFYYWKKRKNKEDILPSIPLTKKALSELDELRKKFMLFLILMKGKDFIFHCQVLCVLMLKTVTNFRQRADPRRN